MSLICEENLTDVIADLQKEHELHARIDSLKQEFRDHQHNFHESGVRHATFGEMIAIAENVRNLETKLSK